MKSVSFTFLFMLFVVSFLTACGGGGGSNQTVSLSLNQSSLSFSATRNASLPAVTQVVATFVGEGVLAGVPAGDTMPDWLYIEYAAAPTATTTTFNVSVTSSNLTAGNHTATLRFLTGSNATNEVAYKDLVVTYTIIDELAVLESSLTFDTVLGNVNAVPTQSLNILGDNINWSMTADQSWVVLNSASGTGPIVTPVSIDASGLPAGQHTAMITVTNTANSYSETVAVTLNIAEPGFALSQNTIAFSGINGKAINTSVIDIALNNGMVTNWSVASSESWLTLSATSGTTPQSITLGVDAQTSSLASGTHTATLIFSATVSGNPVTQIVDVNLTLTPMTFTILPSQISVSGINGSDLGSTAINIALDTDIYNHGWSLTSNNHWLLVDGLVSKNGTNSGSASVTVDASIAPALASGARTGSLTLVAQVNGDTITETINVSLSLTPASFTMSQTVIAFAGINGSDLGATSVDFALNTSNYNYDWTLASSDHWLLVDGLASNFGTNSAATSVTVDASIAPALASGYTSGTLTLVTQVNGDTITEIINVSLSLTQATLTLSQTAIMFEGINGSDLGAQTMDLSLNTDAVTHPFTLTMDSGAGLSWMQSDVTSGQLESTATTITMSTNEIGLPGDVYPGSATVTVQVNGDTITQSIPVNLRLDPQKLFVVDNGVLLSSFPVVGSQLSHTVSVKDNAAQGVIWSATDDASWLTVTASGTSNVDGLVLTADPASLATDILHTATVTITSSDTKIENTETITVGFYVSSADPIASVTQSLTDPEKETDLIADPVRPYVYVSHGGTDIDVYNVYTGTLVTTMTNLGSDLRAMAVSSDGAFLYVLDYVNSSIAKVDLVSQTLATTFTGLSFPACTSCVTNYVYQSLDFTRINSAAVLITAGKQIIDAADGSVIGSLNDPNALGFYSSQAPLIDASDNGEVAIISSAGSSPFSMGRYSLNYSALQGGSFETVLTHKAIGSGPIRDMAVNADATLVYFASGGGCGKTTSYAFCQYSATDLTYVGELAGGAHPISVEISVDGSVYGGIQTNPGLPAAVDVKRYNAAGTLTGSYAELTAQLYSRQLVLSSDSSVMVTRSRRWTGSIYTNDLDFRVVVP